MQYGSLQCPDSQGDPGWNPGLPVLIAEHGGYADVVEPAKLYGALLDSHLEHRSRSQAEKRSGRRMRVNCVPYLVSLLLPWMFFLGIFALNSFFLHYAAPLTTSLVTILILVVSASYTRGAYRDTGTAPEDRFYPVYLGAAMTLACALGWFLGDLNFWSYMQPTYQEVHLATYNNVDPSSQTLWSQEVIPTRGRRFQDSGKMYFTHETVVDTSRAMSFKMGDLYCVAPIVNPNCQANCGNDFWAVGMNCCAEDGSNFTCGEVHNPKAHSGLRLLAESKRGFFRLAVLQEQADPSGRSAMSTHPLFFIWLQDPVAEIARWQKNGYRHFVEVMFGSFFTNAIFLTSTVKSATQYHLMRGVA